NRLWFLIEKLYGFTVPIDKFDRLLQNLAKYNRKHPIEGYLNNLSWDGTPRLDSWLTKYAAALVPEGELGAEYLREVGGLVLEAGARRIFEPGCKFDEMLVLGSKEGLDKSKLLQRLAVKREWFTDHVPLGEDPQRVLEAVEGHWIIEVGELATLKRADIEKVKHQLSTPKDVARKAYARKSTTRYRQ